MVVYNSLMFFIQKIRDIIYAILNYFLFIFEKKKSAVVPIISTLWRNAFFAMPAKARRVVHSWRPRSQKVVVYKITRDKLYPS